MHKRIVTILVIVVVVVGLGLTAHLINGYDGPGLLEQLRRLVHGN